MELRMSRKERDRLKLMEQVEQRRLSQKEAARLMGLSVRQVRRLVKRYREQGDAGLVHRLRGRGSNRKIPPIRRGVALTRIREHYSDFGPTLVAEYLEKDSGVYLSRETLRGWMIEEGLWKSRRRREPKRQRRPRRACFGELVQMDTSLHDWFEGRGEQAVLIAMIDDATSRVFARFFPTDSTETNLSLMRDYLRRYGRPLALYADQASHFRVNLKKDGEVRPGQTQIGRVLAQLDIEYIPAHSPQAKGRVERLFGTLQDRLVKALRLANIERIEAANEFLQKLFLPEFNRRFTVPAARSLDVHRPVKGFSLAAILCPHQRRVVANDFTIRFENQFYQILKEEIRPGLRGARVEVEQRLEGPIKIRWKERYLHYRRIEKTDESARAVTPVGLRPPSVTQHHIAFTLSKLD
ncbi:MAG: ISNCY family transposase [Candidatus Hydrogenedentes bacterium]|nr:ISNCY family transposase [Candidatus Hydrogenedentota bacterium]